MTHLRHAGKSDDNQRAALIGIVHDTPFLMKSTGAPG
jgi:hypothetical protein